MGVACLLMMLQWQADVEAEGRQIKVEMEIGNGKEEEIDDA